MFRDQLGAAAFQMWSDKEESESEESDSLLQKSSFQSLTSLQPFQASSGSSDGQFTVFPSSPGFAHYQFLVPPACSGAIYSQLITFGGLPDS